MERKVFREIVDLRLWIAALATGAFGLILLIVSLFLSGHNILQPFIASLASLLIATIPITLIWELYAKRALINEVNEEIGLEKSLEEIKSILKLHKDLQASGLSRVTRDYMSLDWMELFKKVHRLDIFIAYGRTWRARYTTQLKELALRSDVTIRVVFPDPDNQELINALAHRINGKTSEEISKEIKDAVAEFSNIFAHSPNGGAKISMWYTSVLPNFALYIFDDNIITTLYTHRRQRIGVPTLIFEHGGSIYNFFKEEFEELIDEKNEIARKIEK